MPSTILQIIPAPGWSALYLEDDGTVSQSALSCFALVSYGIQNGQEERGIEAYDSCIGGHEFAPLRGLESNYIGLRSPIMTDEFVANMVKEFLANRKAVWHGTVQVDLESGKELNCGKKVVGDLSAGGPPIS